MALRGCGMDGWIGDHISLVALSKFDFNFLKSLPS